MERKTWPKEGANCTTLLDVSHSPTECKYHSGRILILMIVSIQRNHFFHMGFTKFINELIVSFALSESHIAKDVNDLALYFLLSSFECLCTYSTIS